MKQKLKWKYFAKFFWIAGVYQVQKLSDGGWAWRKAPLTCWTAAPNVHAAKGSCQRDSEVTK